MAGNSVPVVIKLTAVDGVTAKVAAINARLGRITAPIQNYGRAFENLSKEVGLGALGDSIGKIGGAGKEFLGDLFEGATKAGLAVAATGAAVFALVDSFAKSGNEIGNLSKRLGISTDAFQELAYAAYQADIPQEEFVATMTKLQRGMAEARMGTGTAMEAFNALGINMLATGGRVKKSDEVFTEFADKVSRVKDESLRTALVMKAFGKSGAPLLNLLSQGSAGIQKFREEARKIGAVINAEDLKKADEFDSGVKKLTATLTGVRNVIGAAISPALLALGDRFQAFVLENRPAIQKFAEDFAKALPGGIEKAISFFGALADGIKPVISAIEKLADTFGGANVALAAFVGYFFGPAIISLGKFGVAVFEAIGPLSKLAFQIGSFAFGPLINGVGNFVTALRAGYPILQAIGLAFAANPVALWATSIALVVAGVYALYQNWDKVTGAVDRAWASTKNFFGFSDKGVKVGLPAGTPLDQIPPSMIQGPTQQSVTLGAPIGAQGVTQDAARGSVQRNETQLNVNFANMPKGTRIETVKSEAPVDVHMGYASAGAH